MALTKREKKILDEFGNDPHYRIETNGRNQIVAVQLKPEKSNMQRFIDGEEFTINLEALCFANIKFRFVESKCILLNDSGLDPIGIMAAFSTGFLYKQGNRPSSLVSFTEVNFISHD